MPDSCLWGSQAATTSWYLSSPDWHELSHTPILRTQPAPEGRNRPSHALSSKPWCLHAQASLRTCSTCPFAASSQHSLDNALTQVAVSQGATCAAAEVVLRNQGPADVAFSLGAAPGTQLVGLPPWLDVCPCSGVLPAQVGAMITAYPCASCKNGRRGAQCFPGLAADHRHAQGSTASGHQLLIMSGWQQIHRAACSLHAS